MCYEVIMEESALIGSLGNGGCYDTPEDADMLKGH